HGCLLAVRRRCGSMSNARPIRDAMTQELTAAMPPASSDQGRRARQLRRAFQRLLRRRPTTIERVTMDRCALLVARAEAAAADPNRTHNSAVSLAGTAATP